MTAGRFAVTGYFALATGYISLHAIQRGRTAIEYPTWHAWALTTHLVLQALAVGLFAFFTIGRTEPIRRARELRAFASCFVALLAFSLLRQPSATASTARVLAGDLVVVVFGVWLVVAVTRLGRSFGVLPEARELRTSGPYSVVRHPVYLGELGVCAGLVIAAPSPWNLIVGAVFAVAQAIRMRFEEQALTTAFPAYAAYAATTPRLIPVARFMSSTVRKPFTTSSSA